VPSPAAASAHSALPRGLGKLAQPLPWPGFGQAPSRRAAPELERDAGPPVNPSYRLRAAPTNTPLALQDAVVPVSKRLAPVEHKQGVGDGCRSKKILQAQGYFEERPVRATLELERKNVRVNVVEVKSGARFTYQGKLDASFCDHREDGDLLGLLGAVQAKHADPARLRVSLVRNSYFDVDRGRVRLEGTAENRDDASLALWDTPRERLELRDTYQKVLTESDDVEVVLNGPNDTLLLASLAIDGRTLSLTELARSPLRVKQRAQTTLACGYHECHASLSAFELSAQLTVLVAVVSGENCGAKCMSMADWELWTLTPQGFVFGRDLPSTDELPGGLTYSGRSSRTTLYWLDGDGSAPLEILVEHSDSEQEPPRVSITGLDPQTKAYSKTEVLPDTPRDVYKQAVANELVSF
jgi:hypothetical protein